MKTHTQDFKEEIKLLGKQQDVKITYMLNNEQIELTNEDINSVIPNYEGSLLKSVMKQLDIDSNVNIPEGTEINFKYGLLVNGEYEYLDYGNYIVYTSEKQEDTGSYNLVCYDKMLYFMKDYESLGLTYPVTVREYIIALCTKLGLTFKNANDTFPNYDKQLTSDLFEGIGFTYRDVADDLSEVTASTICLDINDEVELRDISIAYELEKKSGNTIHINNSIEAPLQHFRLNGGSKQKTREGYNLLDVLGSKSAGTTHTVNGITYTINADGSIKVEGTATENADYFIAGNWGLTEPIIELDGTYTLQLVDNTNTAIRIYLLNQSNVINSTYGNTTLTKTENVTGWFIRVNSGATVNTTIYPQLVKGGETKPYEQYGAMPSPEYPSKIETVGSNVNLFDKDNANKINGYIDNSGYIQYSTDNKILYIKCISNKDYVVSSRFLRGISFLNEVPKTGLTSTNFKIQNTTELTLNSGENIYLAIWYYATNSNLTEQEILDSIKIEEGDKATACSPYGMGSVEIDVSNKNLFEPTLKNNGATINVSRANITLEEDEFSFECTGTDMYLGQVVNLGKPYYKECGKLINVKNIKNISVLVTNSVFAKSFITCFNKDLISLGFKQFNTNIINNYTLPENVEYITFRFGIDKPVEGTTYKTKVQVEAGELTEYEKYQSQTKIMYTQQEMLEGDYIEDVEHHGWGKYVFTGDETFWEQSNTIENTFKIGCTFLKDSLGYENTETAEVLCSRFKVVSAQEQSAGEKNTLIVNNGKGFIFLIDSNIANSVNEFKLKLAEWYQAGEPLIVYYKLATPIDLELTEEQKEAKKINTYNNVTNINIDNELATLDITYATSVETIDEEYLKDTNVNFGEKYGPINSIVLSRAESDNVYLQDEESIQENGLCELKIKDNQIMNFNDRSDYLPDILNKLKGIEFYLNDFTSTGIMFLELLDRYNVKVAEKIYSCVMFNNEQDITQGLEEQVYTEIPETGETDYTKADKTDQKINQTNLIVDKQNQQIQGIITQIGDRSEKETTITADIDGLSAKVEQIEDVTNNTTGTKVITLENCVAGDLLELHIYGNNTVFDYLLPSDTLLPSNTLYPKGDSRISVINYPSNSEEGTETGLYELGVMEVLRQNGNVYDEYVLKDGQAKIIRRINKDGTIKVNETIEDLGAFRIPLLEGDNEIVIKNYSANMEAKWAIKNDYTDIFSTKVEMNAKFEMQSETINIGLSKKTDKDNLIAEINMSTEKNPDGSQMQIRADIISLIGKILNLGDNMAIVSNNFNVDSQGNVTIGGNENTPAFVVKDDSGNEIEIIPNYIYASFDDGTWATIQKGGFGAGITNINGASIDTVNIDGDYSDPSLHLRNLNSNHTYVRASGITTPTLTQTSLEEQKKNFEKLENALEIIKATDIYKYNLKSEEDGTKKHLGFVIGDKYNYSKELTSKENDGVDIYSLASCCLAGIKELIKQNEEMQKEIEKLKGEK